MGKVQTDTGWGLMCPGCFKVIRAEDTGLRPLLEAADLAFLNQWQYLEFDDGKGGYVCPHCAEWIV